MTFTTKKMCACCGLMCLSKHKKHCTTCYRHNCNNCGNRTHGYGKLCYLCATLPCITAACSGRSRLAYCRECTSRRSTEIVLQCQACKLYKCIPAWYPTCDTCYAAINK